MRVVCAWCDLVLADTGGPVSHGICDSCSLSVERAFHKSLLQKRLAARRRFRPERAPTLPLPGFAMPGFSVSGGMATSR
jgi:hypothetical protein